MNKFENDTGILALQHALDDARRNTRQAEKDGCSQKLICELMDEEDAIKAKLISRGCHPRDC